MSLCEFPRSNADQRVCDIRNEPVSESLLNILTIRGMSSEYVLYNIKELPIHICYMLFISKPLYLPQHVEQEGSKRVFNSLCNVS